MPPSMLAIHILPFNGSCPLIQRLRVRLLRRRGGGLRRVTRAHAVIRLASRVLAYRRGEPFGNGQAKGFVWAIAIFGLEKGSGGFA